MDRTSVEQPGRGTVASRTLDREAASPAPVAGLPVEEALRRAMRQVPAAVTVITTEAGGVPFGMTATPFTTLSLEPPSVIVAVDRRASIHACLQRRPGLAVNILAAAAEPAARAFAAKN